MDVVNSDLLADCNKDLYDILPNPDSLFTNPVSDYCNPPQLNELQGQLSNGLCFLHCNNRSLPKNLSLLNDLLDSLIKPFDIIAITETKLNPLSVDKVDLANYNFFQCDNLTNAGGAGSYVNKDLQAVSRSDTVKYPISGVMLDRVAVWF